MESRHMVFFYGNSLVLAGMRARMSVLPGVEVCSLDGRAIGAKSPCTVIYDMGDGGMDDLLERLQEIPGVLLVGIDPETHAVLLGGQAAGNISLEQITQIIQRSEP